MAKAAGKYKIRCDHCEPKTRYTMMRGRVGLTGTPLFERRAWSGP
jgi:hypothetical protein